MSIFAQPSGSSVFGQSTDNQQNKNTFGSTNSNNNNNNKKPNLFGSLDTGATNPQLSQGSGLFGSLNTGTSTAQPQQGGGLFGATSQSHQGGGIFGSTSAIQKGGSLFEPSQPQQQGGLFGVSQNAPQQPQQGGGLFGLGNSAAQQPQPQQQQGSSLFGGFGQIGQNGQQPSQQGQQPGSVLGQSHGQSRLFQQSDMVPRQKSVIDQIELAFAKWNPASPQTLLQTYLYNSVSPENAPFYGPTDQDDETKWEEALAKKPNPGAIPVLVKGFAQVAARMEVQNQHLQILRGRLHEINEGLNSLLQKHDLQISVRAAECRKKHLRLSRQCLGLAAKTQVLRNRGYAMDSSEEELRRKLLVLERTVSDPALNGRGEEIWARMVSVRERGRQLHREFERAGTTVGEGKRGVIDEVVLQRAQNILEDYHLQLQHLTKELSQIQKDWAEWEQSKPHTITNGIR